MKYLKRAFGLIAIVFPIVLPNAGHSAGVRTQIPSASISKLPDFWSAVMQEFYGAYDKRLKCWTGKIKGENGPVNLCMRPHKLTSVDAGSVQRHFLVMGGFELNETGGRNDCHACSGVAGFVVLQSGVPTLNLVAKSNLATPMGSWGSVPPEESFELRIIGDNDAYGWVVADGYTGQGYTYLSSSIYALIGDRIRNLGLVPTGFNDAGNCENGRNFNHQPCSDYVSTIDFIDSKTAAFHDIRLNYTGFRLGQDRDDHAIVPFDETAMRYKVPENLLQD